MKFARPLICVLCALGLLTACASGQPDRRAGTPRMVWPPPPATARVELVRTIATPADLGIRKSVFRRIMDAFSGGAELHLIRPTGVAEHNGVLYVADPGARSLWLMDPAESHFSPIQEAGDTGLVSPVAVAVRADGAVYVADSVLGKVLLLDRRGKFLGVAAESSLTRPAGLAYDDGKKRLYVADSAGQRILVFDGEGNVLFSWGRRGSGPGEFNYPTHLALGRAGEVLVTDALNFRVQAFDPDGNFLWLFGRHGDTSGELASPKGVAMDSGGHVYVVDALFDSVQLFDPDGTYLMSFGERGSGPGQFWLPGGMYAGKGNRIFVADTYNHRVQEFRFLEPVQPSAAVQQR